MAGPSPALPVSGPGDAAVARVLFLQRTAGNRSVARLAHAGGLSLPPRRVVARQPTEVKFTNTELQQVYDRNKPGSAKQLAALRSLDTTITGVWTQISWPQLAKSTAERIYHPEVMNQGPLGTCGPASVLNFLATNDPESYAALVTEVYRDGTAKGKKVNKTIRGFTPKDGMDVGDWMMMSTIQDITNDFYQYYGSPDSDYPGGPKREGMIPQDIKWALKKFAGVVESDYTGTPKYEDVLPMTRKVNALVLNPNVFIDVHVSGDVLQNPSSGPNKMNHVIRLLKPVTIAEDRDDAKSKVELVAFTWGRIFTWKGTVNQFIHMVWGYTVASTTKGVI